MSKNFPSNCFVYYMAVFLSIIGLTCFQLSVAMSSKETLEQYNYIMESVNHSIDPCEDFYEYACGNSKIAQGIDMKSSMNEVLHYNYVVAAERMIEDLLHESAELAVNNQTFIDKFLIYFSSTKNLNKTEFFDILKPGKNLEWPFIIKLLGGETQNFENFNLFESLGNLFSYGMNQVLLDLSVKRLKNETILVVLNTPNIDDRVTLPIFTRELLEGIGFDNKSKEFVDCKMEVLDYHRSLQSEYDKFMFSWDLVKVFTFKQLKELYPKLATFLEHAVTIQLKNDDIIDVKNVEYIQFLVDKQWQPSEIEKLCNYLMVEFYRYMTPVVNKSRMDNYGLRKYMHMAYDFLYYRIYLKPHELKINKSFHTLWQEIYNQIFSLVENNNLKFTKPQIESIRDKLGKLHISKGNLPDNVNFDMVNEFYGDLPDLSVDSYAINTLYLLKHYFLKTFNCPKHMECTAEIGPIAENFVQDDLMVVPFTLFTQPIYHWKFDALLSISLMGTLLGHELEHSVGISSLLSQRTFPEHYSALHRHFQIDNAVKCVEDQKYSHDMRETEADFVGARAAYQAYAEKYNVQPSYSTISWKKLFFLNMAQYFCQLPDLPAINRDAYDVRLRQIVRNMKEFGEAFQCSVGSEMNPKTKCRFY